MKAVVYRRYGSPEVLGLQEVEPPRPDANQVLVKVHATSINSWDWDLLRGKPLLARFGALFRPRYPILGCDIAGRVVAAGADAHRFQVGDAVFGDISQCGWGGFAEFVCADEDALASKPDGMPFEDAAALPQAGVLALQGLRLPGPIRSGAQVLINGAGGGVGTIAVQIARHHGAEVTCVDRGTKLEMLRSLGAHHLIDYEREDFMASGARYDLILDVVGRRSAFDIERILSANGAYVMVGGSTPRILQVLLAGPWIKMRKGKKLLILPHHPRSEDLEYLAGLYEEGVLRIVLDRCCELDELPAGLRALGDGRVAGKVVVTMPGHGGPPSAAGRGSVP